MGKPHGEGKNLRKHVKVSSSIGARYAYFILIALDFQY